MPVPSGMSQGLWHSKENSLNHRFYLPEVANTGDSGASLNQGAERQMSKISKRKWPRQASKKLAAIENEVTWFWWLIFRTVNNILIPATRHGPQRYLSGNQINLRLVAKIPWSNIRSKNFATVYFFAIWDLTNGDARI